MGMVRSGLVAAFVVGSTAGMVPLTAMSGCIGPMVNGRCLGTETGSPYTGNNSQSQDSSGYRSSTGTLYQYDNSNPIDRNRYSTDLDAQRRDQLNTDPRRDQDRKAGESGGGIKPWGQY